MLPARRLETELSIWFVPLKFRAALCLGDITVGEDRQPYVRAQAPTPHRHRAVAASIGGAQESLVGVFISSAKTGGAGRTLKLLSHPKFKDSPLGPRNPLKETLPRLGKQTETRKWICSLFPDSYQLQ